MSILTEILNEEYERLNKTILSYEAIVADLPKGSIRKKMIGGRKYDYLQWREKNHIRSKYIKPENIIALREQIDRRQGYEKEIKSLKAQKKEFDRVIGREL